MKFATMRPYIPLIYVAFYLMCFVERTACQVNNNNEPNFDAQNAEALYKNFIKRFHRKFKDQDDYYQRYLNFVQTLRTINKINAGATEKVGPNQFADWSDEERYKRMDKMKKRGAMDPEIKAIEDAKLSPPHVGLVYPGSDVYAKYMKEWNRSPEVSSHRVARRLFDRLNKI